ncbi:MAG: hypothetical protein U9O96_00875 [Candidatus Thermoplasmatota archaeon]|nr:hypothetical protein [Candidatus Thermoplasmatota archaeon]
MGRYKSGFEEPPWVYSPSEVMRWINATYPTHKVKKFHAERDKEKKFLKNIEISLDLDVEKREIAPSNFFLKKIEEITGYAKIEEQFEIVPTAELIARGLAKAKFHNMVKITLDGKVLYEHPEKRHDIRKTIELLTSIAHKTKEGKVIRLKAIGNCKEKCIAYVTVERIHPRKKHAVDIKLDGRIEEGLFNRFLNYVKEHLAIEG